MLIFLVIPAGIAGIQTAWMQSKVTKLKACHPWLLDSPPPLPRFRPCRNDNS